MTDHLKWLIVTVVAIGYLGLWIWAMVNAASNRKWGWLILVLLFSPILLFIYLLFGWSRRVPDPNDT